MSRKSKLRNIDLIKEHLKHIKTPLNLEIQRIKYEWNIVKLWKDTSDNIIVSIMTLRTQLESALL